MMYLVNTDLILISSSYKQKKIKKLREMKKTNKSNSLYFLESEYIHTSIPTKIHKTVPLLLRTPLRLRLPGM